MASQIDILEFIVGADPAQWPRLTADQVGALNLHLGSLALDADCELSFAERGQIRSFDNTHRLVFDGANNRLDLHEQGAIRFLTGGPIPAERLRIEPDGKVGIGTATPGHDLDVNGTVNAGTYLINGNPFSGSQWTSQGANISFTGGRVGIGTVAPTEVLEVAGVVKATSFLAGGQPLVSSQWASQGGGISFTGGNVGIGTANPADRLDVAGSLRILTGSNPIRFTPGWTGFPDAVTDQAEISNDTGTYRTLMIVGNKSAGLGRRVSVWDRLEVNGLLSANGNAGVLNLVGADHAYMQWYPKGLAAGRKAWIGYGNAGTDALTIQNDAGRMHIYGTERLYLLNRDGVIVSRAWGGTGNLTVEGSFVYVTGAGGESTYFGGDGWGNDVQIGSTNAGVANVGFWNSATNKYMDIFYRSGHSNSDERSKTNIASVTDTLDRLGQLRPVSFEWKTAEGAGSGERNLGFLAQELEAVFPELVTKHGQDEERFVDYNGVTAVLVEAVRELATRVETLGQRVAELESRSSQGKRSRRQDAGTTRATTTDAEK